MSPKGCILLTIGLPSSGKTLLTNNLISYSKVSPIVINTESIESVLVFYKVSIDELIPISEQLIKVKTNTGFWRQFRQNLLIATKVFVNYLINNNRNEIISSEVKQIFESIKRQNNISINGSKSVENFVIIIDDNLYYKSMRYEWFRTSKELGLGFAQIMINCSLDLAINRNQLRSEDKRLPKEVIIKMFDRFECPQKRGFESKTHFVFAEDFDYSIGSDLVQLIIDGINSPAVDPTIQSTLELELELRQTLNTESKHNLIHKIDCILRQIINEFMNQSIDRKTISKTLMESKKCLLTDLKKSIDILPQNLIQDIMETDSTLHFSHEIKMFFKNLLLNK